MCVDHLKYVDLTSSWAILYEILGRPAFPLFAVLVGWNLTHSSTNPNKFSIRILFAGIIMEGVQYLCLSPITGPEELNTFITLALGALLTNTIIGIYPKNFSFKNLTFCGFILFSCLFLSSSCQYGLPGILLVCFVALPNFSKIKILPTTLSLATNPLPLYSGIAASATFTSLFILQSPNIKPCPLPNSKWLYLALPASFLPAWLHYQHLFL